MASYRYNYQYGYNSKLLKNFSINNKYIYYYFELFFYLEIIKIQALYRAYKVRKKLKIYKRLPTELQREILINIKNEFYLERYNKNLLKVLIKKIKDESYKLNSLFVVSTIQFYNLYANLDLYDTDYNVIVFVNLMNKFVNLLKLILKYDKLFIKCKELYFTFKLINEFIKDNNLQLIYKTYSINTHILLFVKFYDNYKNSLLD